MAFPKLVEGDHVGAAFPASVDVLLEDAPGHLTRLFRASGAIGPDNAVTQVTHWREFFGGGMGRKMEIDVRYAQPSPDLPVRLFAKFTREFGDPLRELFSPVMDPEVRFAMLSRRADFPVRVPWCMFGDYSAADKTGLLITERVPYGAEGVEPALDKCLDYRIADPLPYYESQTRAIAALAAFHRSGRFGDVVERQFPFRADDPAILKVIPFDQMALSEKLAKLRTFVRDAPQLLPQEMADPAFLDAFCADAALLLEKEAALWAFLHAQTDLVALAHWNMNPDNAWFWHDKAGILQSGQLDWGGVGQANIAQSYFGMICAAETDFLEAHDTHLRALLLERYAALGGPVIESGLFDSCVLLATGLLGVAWMLDAPTLIEAEIGDHASLTSRFDPRIRDQFIPRAQLHLMTVFLWLWRRHDIGALIRRFPA
ncbi:hypothetical protein [Sphingobium sp.]|uniref:hypothetical protein n=1 Tax=Sphingobium sp. TaxID=1912891 RepID=UPI00260DE2CC|nr:hypothetical protein [Sphingobium sp.]